MISLPAYSVLLLYVIAYWILFAVSSLKSIVLLVTRKNSNWSITKIVCCLIPLIFGVRAVDLSFHLEHIADYYFVIPVGEQTPITMILDSLPGYFFISTYILLGLFWFSLYSKSFQTSMAIVKYTQIVYGIVNLILYTVWCALYVLLWFPQWTLSVHKAEAIYTTVISLLVAFIFSIGGTKFHSMVRKHAVVFPERWRIARKVAILTVICTIVFVIRASIIVSSIYYFKDQLPSFIIRICYLTFLEIIPSVSIMAILVKPSPNQLEEKIPLNRATITSGYLYA